MIMLWNQERDHFDQAATEMRSESRLGDAAIFAKMMPID